MVEQPGRGRSEGEAPAHYVVESRGAVGLHATQPIVQPAVHLTRPGVRPRRLLTRKKGPRSVKEKRVCVELWKAGGSRLHATQPIVHPVVHLTRPGVRPRRLLARKILGL